MKATQLKPNSNRSRTSLRREYGISAEYAHSWNPVMAAREIWANARGFDSPTLSYNPETRILTIEDRGPGIPQDAFKIGYSENRMNQDVLGMFGEGAKIAGLVLARASRKFRIITRGYAAWFTIEDSETWGSDTFCVYLDPAESYPGTQVQIELTREEFTEFESLFLELTPGADTEIAPSILATPGIFILGMRSDSWDGFYGYEIGKQSSLHRDRVGLETQIKRQAVAKIWRSTESQTAITRYLTAWQESNDFEEYSIGLTWVDDSAPWIQAIVNLHGTRVCVGTDDAATYKARAAGWTVISGMPYSLRSLFQYLGYQSDSHVIVPATPVTLHVKDLPTPLRKRFQSGVEFCQSLYFVDDSGEQIRYEIYNPQAAGNESFSGAAGLWKPSLHTIYVSLPTLHDREETLGTLIHELAHAISGCGDFTTGFQESLTQLVGKIAFRNTLRVV